MLVPAEFLTAGFQLQVNDPRAVANCPLVCPPARLATKMVKMMHTMVEMMMVEVMMELKMLTMVKMLIEL